MQKADRQIATDNTNNLLGIVSEENMNIMEALRKKTAATKLTKRLIKSQVKAIVFSIFVGSAVLRELK
jgi:hypothetical protein